jgi:hypothetical protein
MTDGSPPDKVEQLNSGRRLSPHLQANGPDEVEQFPRDRGDNNGGLLTPGDHGTIPSTQSGLCLSGDVADVLRRPHEDLALRAGY